MGQVDARNRIGNRSRAFFRLVSIASKFLFHVSVHALIWMLDEGIESTCCDFWGNGYFFFFFFCALKFVQGSLLGVPFSVIVLGIMALVLLLSHEGFFRVFVWSCIGAAVSLVPQFLIDRYFYGKWVCAVCNIISYNALDNDSTL